MKGKLLVGLILARVACHFAGRHLGGVTAIEPEVERAPIQAELRSKTPFLFSLEGVEYRVTPQFGYELSGVAVSVRDYRWVSISKTDAGFPFDLCLVWGENVASGAFRDPNVQFSQDCRHCYAKWSRDVGFKLDQLSNNHLLIDQPAVFKTIGGIRRGDQVRLKGKLVDVAMRGPGTTPERTIKTSVTRTDGGAGACEVIYVEEAEVLRRANPVARMLSLACLCAVGGVVVWGIADLFTPFRAQ
jgi:hypothetical protein